MASLIIWNSFHSTDYPHDFSTKRLVRPLGPHQLATWLSSYGHDVKVIDFCNIMTTDQLVELTEKFMDSNTVAIGLSTSFIYRDAATLEPSWVKQARDILEKKYQNLDWIIGGSRNNSHLVAKYKWRYFDGYAEDIVLKYLDEKSNKIITRTPFDIVDLEYQYMDGMGLTEYEVMPFQISRGCQFKCTFCKYPLIGRKKNTYIRDLKLVERELLEMYDRYGTTSYYFVDDTFNESEEKLIGMAEIASRLPFKLNWIGYLRLDLIGAKPHTADLLIQSGLRSALFGIETFGQEASKVIGKGWNGVRGKDFLLELKDRWGEDVTWSLSMIIGLPGDTVESIYETQDWLVQNQMNTWLWWGLNLERMANYSIYQSEFEKNYANYGYRFPDNEGWLWEHDYWNKRQVDKIAKELNDASLLRHCKVGPWALGELASIGYPIDHFQHSYRGDVDYKQLNREIEQFVQKYVEYQRAL